MFSCSFLGETLTFYRSGNPYSVIEMHTFVVTLIRQFKFALPDDGPRIRRWRSGLIVPVIVGEEHKGAQLPLKVTRLENE